MLFHKKFLTRRTLRLFPCVLFSGAIVLLSSIPLAVAQTNFYWNGVGSVNAAASWGTNPDGTGTAPANFTTANQLFNIQTTQSPVLGGGWTISGASSRLVVQTGGTFTSGANNPTLTVDLQSGALYVMNHTTYGALSFGTINSASTFRLDNQTNPRASGLTYGNFVFNGTTNVSLSSNLAVNGTLQVSNSGELRLTNTANVTHAVQNLTIDSTRTANLTNSTGNLILNLAGNLSNGGTLSKGGAGTATINFSGTGTSTATWGTVTAASAAVNIASGRTVTFLDTLTTTGTRTLTNSGTLNLGNGGTTGFVSGNVANNGSLVFNRSDGVNYSGTISGTGSLTKLGGAALTLSGSNTYQGDTNISDGTLVLQTAGTNNIPNSPLINLALATSTLNVASVSGGFTLAPGQTLSGIGSIGGAATAGGDSIIAPGNSAGQLSINNNLNFATDSTYAWELAAFATTGPGTNWDRIAITSGGSLSVASGTELALGFIGSASSPAGPTPNVFWTTSQIWSNIIDVAGPGSVSGATNFAIDNSPWASNGLFTTAPSGTGVDLIWTPIAIPEPSSLAMMLFGCITIWLFGGQRKRMR